MPFWACLPRSKMLFSVQICENRPPTFSVQFWLNYPSRIERQSQFSVRLFTSLRNISEEVTSLVLKVCGDVKMRFLSRFFCLSCAYSFFHFYSHFFLLTSFLLLSPFYFLSLICYEKISLQIFKSFSKIKKNFFCNFRVMVAI